MVVSAAAQATPGKARKGAPAPQGVSRAPNKQSQAARGGNSWFGVTVRELGTFYGQGEAIGTFNFKNPHNDAVEWRSMQPSCQCASAEIRIGDRTYRVIAKPTKRVVRVTKREGQPDKLENVTSITIGPGEEGVVETRLNMHNITGVKSATLDIHTTDPVEPQFKLTFRATGAELFSISPKEVNLNKMTWNETREFKVVVGGSATKDWKIISMDEADDAFDVTWEKTGTGNFTSYTISGKYGPVNGETGGGGVLKFRTNLNGAATFNVRVLAFVQGPLEVKPGGFLTLGLIRKGKPITKNIIFEPNDGIDLKATDLVFEKTSLAKEFITATQRKDGDKLIIELSVANNAPAGLVKGELVVKLNHPLIKEKRIVFNGFVR
ncbi:MAG: hypothetical protein ACI89X_005130 [Planctomycetota bacterium]|jgi:hypothetical protein